MQYQLEINDRPFKAILNGTKKVEGRTITEFDKTSYNKFKQNNLIVFINNISNKTLMVKIRFVRHYPNVKKLLEAEGVLHVLSSTPKTIEHGIESYNSLEGYKEGITKNGIYAIGIELLPYRNNVCCILFKKSKYLIVQLVDWNDKWWKFPQGGIDKGETIEETIKRELFEELHITNFRIVKKFKFKNKYDWPEHVIIRNNSRWRGQDQTFCKVEFTGKNSEIKLDPTEVKKYKWVSKEKLLEIISSIEGLNANYKKIIQKVVK